MSILGQIEAIVDRILGRRIDYLHPWVGTIVSQVGDNVDFTPDDTRLPHLIGVPLRTGVAGVRVQVASGARARAWFDDGDPTKPFVALWDIGTVTGIDIAGEGGPPIARQGDLIIVTIPGSEIAKAVLAMGGTAPPSGGLVTYPSSGLAPPVQGAGYITSGSAKVRST